MEELCVPCWDAHGQCGHPEVRPSDEYGSFLTSAMVTGETVQILDEVRCTVCGQSLQVETTIEPDALKTLPAPLTRAFLEHRLSLAMAKQALSLCVHDGHPTPHGPKDTDS
jgi:hypothetical protein